jgi:hypothetical protein
VRCPGIHLEGRVRDELGRAICVANGNDLVNISVQDQGRDIDSGPRVAAVVSIVETCRRLKIPIRDYLCSILPGLADFPIKRIAEFTPGAWAARN